MIFSEDGPRYRTIKSAMQSAFTDRAIKTWYHLFWYKAMDMVKIIPGAAARDINGALLVDVHAVSRPYTMSGILQSIFGSKVDTSAQMKTLPPLFETVFRPAWDITLYFMFAAAFPLWTLRLIPGRIEARVDRAGEKLRHAVKELIQARRSSTGDDENDMLMQLSKQGRMNDSELASNLLGLCMPGMETSSASFSWTIMHLARHPEWQMRLREELEAAMGTGPIDYETLGRQSPAILDNLPILDSVCNESMRLSPPSPMSVRITHRDCVIADQPVPAGTRIFLCNYLYNRSEEFYGPTVNVWNPDRWLSRDSSSVRIGTATSTHAAYMVFSHGPRRCIGLKYAHAVLRAFVAALVMSFEFELENPNDAIVAGGSLVSSPNPGVKLRLRFIER